MHFDRLYIEAKNIARQKVFYAQILNLPVKSLSARKIEVQVGDSVLEISENPGFTPYHIAFHLSAEKENPALTWLKKKVDILKMGKQEIIDFSSWNAKSIYFYDADHNVLEFISRRHLYQTNNKGFSKKDIRGIAEIGLATQNVRAAYDNIYQKTGLPQYFGDFEKFCPIGDDEGLLITIDNRQKPTWFPTKDKAFASPFVLDFSHSNQTYRLAFDGKAILWR